MRMIAVCVVVATCLAGSAKADWPDWLLDNGAVIQKIMPDSVYVFGTATEAHLTYGGGVEWMADGWWGFGLEYRQAPVRMASSRQHGTVHIAGAKLVAETPAFRRISLRPEIGAAVLLGESDAVKIDPSWAASARLGVRLRLTGRLSAGGWVGAVQTGRVNTGDGYFSPKLMPDYGVGIAVGL
jgi:hypothetical protein